MDAYADLYYDQEPGDLVSQVVSEDEWKKAVKGTYEMLNANQDPCTGLITNWFEYWRDGHHQIGMSGSGTPPAEYGSEAARAMFRISMDLLWYPAGAENSWAYLASLDSHRFLRRVAEYIESRIDINNPAPGNGILHLQTSRQIGSTGYVESIEPGWPWTPFMLKKNSRNFLVSREVREKFMVYILQNS
jgi:hypothetical protein